MQQFYTSSLLIQGQGVPVVIRWLTFNLAKILKIIPEEAPGTQGRGREAPEETLRKRPSDELQQQGMRLLLWQNLAFAVAGLRRAEAHLPVQCPLWTLWSPEEQVTESVRKYS